MLMSSMVLCSNGKNLKKFKDLNEPSLEVTKIIHDYLLDRVKRVPVTKEKLVNRVQPTNKGIDGTLEVTGTPECETKVCEAAMCAVVDDWFLFDQTCNMLGDSTGSKICSKNLVYIHCICSVN